MFSNDVAKGLVVSTIPPAGQPAAYQSTVQVIVSHGPIMVDIPNLFGLTSDEVATKLRALGVSWDYQGPHPPGSVVATQDPAAGSTVPLETTKVLLTFAVPANPGP